MMEATEGTRESTEMNLSAKYKLTEKTGLYAYYSTYDSDTAANEQDPYEKLGVQLSAKF